jgi:hypothetical protein
MCSRILISLEGRLKSHPSFTSLLQNNLFRETVFSLLHLVRKQENRDYRIKSPFQKPLRRSALEENYEISTDWEGVLYCGIKLTWEYAAQ